MGSTTPRIIPSTSVSITVLRGNDDKTTKEEGTENVSSPPGLFVLSPLCEGRDGVRPGLDRGPDCLIGIGREGDPARG